MLIIVAVTSNTSRTIAEIMVADEAPRALKSTDAAAHVSATDGIMKLRENSIPQMQATLGYIV